VAPLLLPDVEHFPDGIQPLKKTTMGKALLFGQADCQEQQK
jgi:Ni,Fe-hydrogenase III component G